MLLWLAMTHELDEDQKAEAIENLRNGMIGVGATEEEITAFNTVVVESEDL